MQIAFALAMGGLGFIEPAQVWNQKKIVLGKILSTNDTKCGWFYGVKKEAKNRYTYSGMSFGNDFNKSLESVPNDNRLSPNIFKQSPH